MFYDKRDPSFMSRPAIISKFEMRWFPNEGLLSWKVANKYKFSTSYA